MKNKIIAVLLTLSMLLSQCLIMPTFAASDYEGHWAEDEIERLITAGVVAGDENGKINPDNSIKRSEFVKIVNRKFNFTNTGTENFPDVSADAWYANEFKIAKAQGYLTGDDKGNANPDNPITRAEVSVIIARVLKLNDDYSSVKAFSDDAAIPSWAKDSVYRLNLKGYINGYPDGSFKAQNTITRAESFTIIAKITTTSSTPTIPSGGGFGGGSSGGGGGSSSGGSSGGGGGGGSSSGGNSGGNTEKEPENKDRTPEELKELNDNKEPEIENREDSDIGLYTGVYSEVKVDDVDDAIDSLENVKTLLNIGDVEEEFVPFDDEGSTIDENTYKIQQVYNGVPVANAQTIISVNEEGYPDSILNRYDDSVRLSGINTIPSISEAKAKEIILADLISKDAEYTNGNIESIYLEIQADQEILTYHAYVTCDNSLGFNYYVDAHSGEVVVANEITPDYAYTPNGYTVQGNMWGLSTNLYYDTTLERYTFYNDTNKITVYNMQGADGNPIYDGKLPVKRPTLPTVTNPNGVPVKYDDMVAMLPPTEAESGYWEDKNLGFVNITGSSDLTADAFFALYNFDKTLSAYSNIIKAHTPKVNVSINLDWNNCVAFGSSLYQFTTAYKVGGVLELDTVAHEFTHYFQNSYIAPRDYNKSLGDNYGVDNSSNPQWLESVAISEGTADIMGMLVEAIAGEVEFNSTDFWVWGEDFNGNGGTHHNTPSLDCVNHEDTTEHFTQCQVHSTVTQMKEYWDAHPNTEYPNGPGHLDRYILGNAFSKMVSIVSELDLNQRKIFKSTNSDSKIWFKLWGNTIKKLTPASDFAEIRLALINTANEMNLSWFEREAIKEGLKAVGITDGHNANENIAWYMPYVNDAVEDGILTANDSSGFNYDQPMTRKELLTLIMKYAKINGVSDNHTSNINWAYSYGILNDNWLDSKYQNETIARWEAARVIFGVLNYAHEKTNIFCYPLYGGDRTFDDFQNEMFKDWGASIAPDDSAIINLLNLNTSYSDYIYPKITDASQIQERYLKFCTEHSWTETLNNQKTYNMLYYWGMYQLWQNGKFGGQSINGEKYLKITDQILCGEVCAILYK